MRYFLLGQEANCSDLPIVINWYGTIDIRNITKEKCHQLPKREVLRIESNEHTKFYDVLSKPFFLVTGKVMRIIKLYLPYVISKEIILLDTVNGIAELYFLPILDTVKCLSIDSKLSLDSSTILSPVFSANKTNNHPIFKVGDVKNNYIAVNLEFAESLLKNDCKGIGLTSVYLL